MALILGGVAIASAGIGLAGAIAAGRLRSSKGGTLLIGNHLDKIPPFYIYAPRHIPTIVVLCCEELERRNKLPEKPDWSNEFESIEVAKVEETELLNNTIKSFRDNNPRHQKKTKLKDLSTKQVLDVLFYYLYTLPDPLCTGEKYELFKSIDEKFRGSSDIEAHRKAITDAILEIPGNSRMTTLRIIEFCHNLIKDCSDDDKVKLMKCFIKWINPITLAPPYPVVEIPEENQEDKQEEKQDEKQEEKTDKKADKKKKKRGELEDIHCDIHLPSIEDCLPETFQFLISEYQPIYDVVKAVRIAPPHK